MPTAAATEIVEIRNRFTDAVIFTAGVEVGLATVGLKLGAAVRIAIEAQANLHGASLPGANLSGANLLSADLRGADLKGAHGALDCGAPHGWRIVVVLHDDGIRIAAGCRWLTFSAAVDHWRNRDDRKLMPPLLAYIRAACAINGWPLDEDRLVEG